MTQFNEGQEYRRNFPQHSTGKLQAMLAQPTMPPCTSRLAVELEIKARRNGSNKPIVTPQIK
jgi:hypothetical protein